MKINRAIWIVAALSVAVLVPLYGDTRKSPVTHAEWGRMMMRSLDFEDHLKSLESASEAFEILAWKNERTIPAANYKRSVGLVSREVFVDATEQTGEAAYDLLIVRSGDYGVRLRLRGAPDRAFKVEIRKDGLIDSIQTFRPTGSGPAYTSVDLGWVRLDSGTYTISVALPPGTSLESIQVSPPCLADIEPENGWRAAALTTAADLARTMLQAIEKEGELPPAEEPTVVRAGEFERLAPYAALDASNRDAQDYEIKATAEGLHAVVHANVSAAGLYAVSAWTAGGEGQSWLADSCRRADLCPNANQTPSWRTALTSDFNVGRHSFAVLLTNGARLGRLRLQRLKTSPEDYVDALKGVGFDAGPKGPITREKAREAMDWLRARWKQDLENRCVVRAPIGTLSASGQLAGGSAGTGLGIPGLVPPPTTATHPPSNPPQPPPPGLGGPGTPGNPQPPATPILPRP